MSRISIKTRTGSTRLKQHFTEAQIVELTAVIALENFRSKFNPTLGVEAQGFCMVPAAGAKKTVQGPISSVGPCAHRCRHWDG